MIGMPEAGKRIGLSGRSAKRALRDAGITLHAINARALAVEESDLNAFIASRAGYSGRGRPKGTGTIKMVETAEPKDSSKL